MECTVSLTGKSGIYNVTTKTLYNIYDLICDFIELASEANLNYYILEDIIKNYKYYELSDSKFGLYNNEKMKTIIDHRSFFTKRNLSNKLLNDYLEKGYNNAK